VPSELRAGSQRQGCGLAGRLSGRGAGEVGGSVAWAVAWAAHSVGDWMLTSSQRPCSRPACRSSSNEPACGGSGVSAQGGQQEGPGGRRRDRVRRSLTVEAHLGRTTVDVREGLGPARVVPGVLTPCFYRVRLRIPKSLKPVRDRRSGRRRHALRRVHERVLVLAHRRAVQQRVCGLIGKHTGKHTAGGAIERHTGAAACRCCASTGAAACRCCASAHQAVDGCLHIPVVRLEKREGKPVVVRARDRLEHG